MSFPSLPLNASQVANSLGGTSGQSISSTIEQTERLFTTRTRGINYTTGGGDRGQHTYIQLLTKNTTNIVDIHTSEGMSKPTSLGTNTQGPLVDAVNAKYGDFLLTDIRGGFDEKLQVTEVFGDAEIVYYFGRQPMNMQFQGLVIDSPDNNWFIQWIEMYAHVLRGTELAKNYELIKIITPNMSFIGTLTHMGWNQNSTRDADIPFEFNMLVKQIIPNAVMISGKPTTQGISLNADKVANYVTQSQIYSQKSAASNLVNIIQNPFSTVSDFAGAMTVSSPLSSGSSVLNSVSGFTNVNNLIGGFSQLNPLSSSGTSSTTSSGLDIFTNVTSNLAGIRASLFSPVYGVLNSLTKLISSSGGGINSVISSFTNPVRTILRDVRNISNQAVGVINLINNNIMGATNQIRNVDSDLRATLATLKKTAGVISTAPQTITSHLRDLVNSGKLPATTGYLQNSGTTMLISGSTHTTKIFLLNSGSKHTPQSGATL